MFLQGLIVCALLTLGVNGKPFDSKADPVCGYEACPEYDPNVLNVHIVPHSHDDVGWLKTVDQYYDDDVQHIITTVTAALLENPERRYIQVETAFFKKWWEQQSDETKQNVQNLVDAGQLEFTGGAWSMNDEAAYHYHSAIDSFTLGFRYLDDNLGECARVRTGWQIDPFGHSREQASLSAQLGFDSLFFVRIDYRDKDHRLNTKTADLIWRGSQSLGNTSDIFTNVFRGHYSSPGGFCFDIVCNDAEIDDDPNSSGFNQQQRVEDFANYARGHADLYATNNILVPFGDDFRYEQADKNFRNLDKLIRGSELFPQTDNSNRPMRLFYSTPTCYAKFVNEYVSNNNYELQVKTDDFFPYADGPNTYWTGYFTSRAASKRYERVGNNILQVAKQLSAVVGGSFENTNIRPLKEAMGILQHHDAITGTEKQHVADNYHLLLTAGIDQATESSSDYLSSMIGGGGSVHLGFRSCLLANVSSCQPAAGDRFTIAVYNPLSRVSGGPISIPVNYEGWTILDPSGEEVSYQVSSPIKDFNYVDNVPHSQYVLEFFARDIPALGYNVYTFEASDKKKQNTVEPRLLVGFEDTSFEIDDSTGLLTHVTMNGLRLEVSQEFLYYSSQDSSGAYIFVPTAQTPKSVASGSVTVTPISGDVYQGVVQEFSDWAKQTIKVYNDDRGYIEFDWIIGPVTYDENGVGKEVITRFSTYLQSEGSFYTDTNGRELLKRTRNSRSDYNYTNEQPVAGNYYPVNSKILIRDEGQGVEFAVLTDRSEGGSSIVDGQLEIMLHRVCQHDDGRGVGENLNEQEYGQGIVIRGKHHLVLGNIQGNGEKSLAAIERDIAQRTLLAPWLFITDDDVSENLVHLQGSALVSSLPDNVQILTLEDWQDNTLLIRLEHVLAVDEDPNLSQDVTVDLTDAFNQFTITELQETTLGGNILLAAQSRLHWPGSNESESDAKSLNVENRKKRAAEDLQITLAPMQIRTFLATIATK